MRIAIYPGSFDPITLGHLDIIKRAAKLFDKLYILVAINKKKNSTFTIDEKIEMINLVTKDIPNLEVVKSEDLVSKYALRVGACAIIRGLRNFNDYQDEISLFHFNHSIAPDVETLALFPSANNLFLSSSSIKELVSFDADISDYIHKDIKDFVQKVIKERLK